MNAEPLRLLIVDDSRIFRAALQDALEGRAGIRVVGSVWSGEKALEFIRQSPPDLVTLDVNMPGQGGLETLGEIQKFNATRPDLPPVAVLLVSALTSRGAATTVEGLERGAFDFIRKPDGPDEKSNALLLQQQLLEKIEPFAQRRARLTGPATPPSKPAAATEVARAGRFHAVAIGSSTGGPEALALLLPALTKRISVPLFIVQHMSPGMTAYFAASLARKCDYRVVEASHGETVQPRTAYVAPGGRHMIMRSQEGRIVTALNDEPPENRCRPSVDVFFRSLAAAYPPSVIAIILTGMDCDGAKGLGPLKRKGAYVIAQDEASSVVWGMPGAAVATNLVDAVLPLEHIGTTVAALLGAQDVAMHLSVTAFNEIRQVVHDLCGIALSDDKDYLVKSRLEPILHSNGLASYEVLLHLLKQPNALLLQYQLIEAITTKETSFNRDGHPFEALRRSILPNLASAHIKRPAAERLACPRVRIWCAAVATGQEAYSVAMALADFLAARTVPGVTIDDFSILASDISANALAAAREGRYSTADVARGISAQQRDRFFREANRSWVVDASLRRNVDFRRLNLVLPLPDVGAFDLILCRNLLIYLDEDARRRLCQVLHTALHPGGILMIGAAESLYGVTDAFQVEQYGQTVVYRKQ